MEIKLIIWRFLQEVPAFDVIVMNQEEIFAEMGAGQKVEMPKIAS